MYILILQIGIFFMKKGVKKLSIGDAIRKHRKRQGITMEELAKKIGISQPYLSQIERGNKKCPIELLDKISKELQVDLSIFFDESRIELKEWIDIGRLLSVDERMSLITFLKLVKPPSI